MALSFNPSQLAWLIGAVEDTWSSTGADSTMKAAILQELRTEYALLHPHKLTDSDRRLIREAEAYGKVQKVGVIQGPPKVKIGALMTGEDILQVLGLDGKQPVSAVSAIGRSVPMFEVAANQGTNSE